MTSKSSWRAYIEDLDSKIGAELKAPDCWADEVDELEGGPEEQASSLNQNGNHAQREPHSSGQQDGKSTRSASFTEGTAHRPSLASLRSPSESTAADHGVFFTNSTWAGDDTNEDAIVDGDSDSDDESFYTAPESQPHEAHEVPENPDETVSDLYDQPLDDDYDDDDDPDPIPDGPYFPSSTDVCDAPGAARAACAGFLAHGASGHYLRHRFGSDDAGDWTARCICHEELDDWAARRRDAHRWAIASGDPARYPHKRPDGFTLYPIPGEEEEEGGKVSSRADENGRPVPRLVVTTPEGRNMFPRDENRWPDPPLRSC